MQVGTYEALRTTLSGLWDPIASLKTKQILERGTYTNGGKNETVARVIMQSTCYYGINLLFKGDPLGVLLPVVVAECNRFLLLPNTFVAVAVREVADTALVADLVTDPGAVVRGKVL